MYSIWLMPATVLEALIWLLLAMMLAALMYSVWSVTRSGTRELLGGIPSASEPPTHLEIVPEPIWTRTRTIKWISIGEFKTVLTKCSDLIVIDLRASALLIPFPVPTANVLPIAPDELFKVLECLPADRTVALCGASKISVFMIETIPCKEGSAPLYVLEGDLGLAEVA